MLTHPHRTNTYVQQLFDIRQNKPHNNKYSAFLDTFQVRVFGLFFSFDEPTVKSCLLLQQTVKPPVTTLLLLCNRRSLSTFILSAYYLTFFLIVYTPKDVNMIIRYTIYSPPIRYPIQRLNLPLISAGISAAALITRHAGISRSIP